MRGATGTASLPRRDAIVDRHRRGHTLRLAIMLVVFGVVSASPVFASPQSSSASPEPALLEVESGDTPPNVEHDEAPDDVARPSDDEVRPTQGAVETAPPSPSTPPPTPSPYETEMGSEDDASIPPEGPPRGPSTGTLIAAPLLGIPALGLLFTTALVGNAIGLLAAAGTSNYLTRVLGFETASAMSAGILAAGGILNAAVFGGGALFLVNWIFLTSKEAAVLTSIAVGTLAATASVIAGASIVLAIGNTDSLILLGPAFAAPLVGAVAGGAAAAIAAPFVLNAFVVDAAEDSE